MFKFTLRTVSANSVDRLARRVGSTAQIDESRKHLVLEGCAWQLVAFNGALSNGERCDFLAYF